ncbi:hypothetical protein [Treponema endosymbiont of Eucomonympha sp.]|uniref:hypothetical protein n=1 Tax=Treponema endosymbiont of Eucomonympha sp. TaxID=1580831 RepID=UPI0007513929|nr:hypothetical protein [Treponema endosymbiont of Eucomonympha sp.]
MFTPAKSKRNSEYGVMLEESFQQHKAGNVIELKPETLEEIQNAETIAAIQEGNDMLSGKIPVKWFDSFEEFWADLDS